MRSKGSDKNWFPLSKQAKISGREPTGEAFQTKWIDFERGIRVGNIEPHERITRIVKYHLEQTHATPFVTDRWGRGVFWQWICWLPKANRSAKPVSHSYNFGCAKFFITVDKQRRVFQSGLQVERGRVSQAPDSEAVSVCLQDDWDWHRLMRASAMESKSAMESGLHLELRRLLVQDGFVAELAGENHRLVLNRNTYCSAAQLSQAAAQLSDDGWAFFQLYYPMPEREVRACSGYELVKALLAVFLEVVPVMNRCMQVPLQTQKQSPVLGAHAERS